MKPPLPKNSSSPLRQAMVQKLLKPAFQPIVSFQDGSVFAFEALIRGLAGTELESPDQLFAAARKEGISHELELYCCRAAVREFARQGMNGQLFINLSAPMIEAFGEAQGGELLQEVLNCGTPPNRIVLELTEHERVERPERLVAAILPLKALGVRLAIDDFGDGRSSLRLWAELSPDIVKVDRYFISGIDSDVRKLESVRAMLRLAQVFGNSLVAEGIETEAELAVLRDLGITYGQGYFLGRPAFLPDLGLPIAARNVLASTKIAIYPDLRPALGRTETAEKLCISAPSVSPAMDSHALAQLFERHSDLHAVAVVDKGRPQGLINHQRFLERYTRPFHREIYGRKSCTMFMQASPLLVERSTPLDALSAVLAGDDQRYLQDGFILTENGQYFGLGTGQSLVRAVTELRIEAARHANPLTALPGNIPISEHIGRLLASGTSFSAAYFDLNHFKPYNDLYGYWRGDEMIKLAARSIAARCDPLRDFIGHVGGDDFVVMFQSDDWESRCHAIVENFNAAAMGLFDATELARNGIEGEDRRGNPSFFPITTLSVGVVQIRSGDYTTAEEVASAAAAAKRSAKKKVGGIDCRGSLSASFPMTSEHATMM